GGTVTQVNTGVGLTGGPITGAGTISIASSGVSNDMLANPSFTVNAGTGLTGGGVAGLGGILSLSNSGLLSLSVNAPLASSGGQNPTLSLSTVDIAHGGTGIANGPISAGQFLRSTGAGTWAVGTIQAGDLPAMPAWSLAGNAATGCGASPCATFLGTTDDSALELRVNNTRAYRIEPAVINGDPIPNIIGGSSGNNVTPGAVGATIAGGGSGCAICFNEVTDDFGTVGGGTGNRAGDNSGSTSDGIATYATVAGGLNNTASGNSSTVIGGFGNTASGFGSTVAGGSSNFATGDFSFVGGCSANSNN